MRQRIELSPLPALPADPSSFLDGVVCFLHSGDGRGRSLLALGSADELRVEEPGRAFEALDRFLKEHGDWCFGHFSYGLKDEVEELSSSRPDPIGSPALHFFRPILLFILEEERCQALFLADRIDEDEVKRIHSVLSEPEELRPKTETPQLRSRIDRGTYLKKVQELQNAIQKGDIYEVNFCQEFFAEGVELDPYRSFTKLQSIAKAPMGAFYRYGDPCLISASPERFLRFQGDRVTAQPIKGTAPRGESSETDARIKEELGKDPKERAENIMIVDLVRNDLSRTASKGSVEVEELCGVHSFPTVHQMISTVRSRVADGLTPVDVIRNAFPMGSMTGAPKVRAMELIEATEGMDRGLYSGSVGYFDPEGNGDFNVVIRSLLYNARTKFLSAMVGGAITARADAEKEYEECLLKAEALKKAIA